MTSAVVQVNGSPVPVGGSQVTPGSTVLVSLDDASGVGSWALACKEADAASSPMEISASIKLDGRRFLATLPAPADGRTFHLISVVNGGIGPGVYDPNNVYFFDLYAGALKAPAVPSTEPLTFVARPATDLALTSLDVSGLLNLWTAQGGGWTDIVGHVMGPTTGPNTPTWSQMGGGPFYAFRFSIGETRWFKYHIRHDYTPATDIFVHAHWTTDGTSTAAVAWEFTYAYAKGHNQQNYTISGTTVTASESAHGTAWRHMTTEIATGISNAGFEPDGILMVRLRRVANGGADNPDAVFLITADCHHQVSTVSTKNRLPPFYT